MQRRAPAACQAACPLQEYGTEHRVTTFSGCGSERVTYVCSCGHFWNQKPASKLSVGEDPGIMPSNRAALGGSGRGDYRCKTCGQIKKGHVCPGPPPVPATEDPGIMPSNRAALGGSGRAVHRCKTCGEIKKGHVCSGPASVPASRISKGRVVSGSASRREARKGRVCSPTTTEASTPTVETSTPPPVDPPEPVLTEAQYMDMLKFSSPPTVAERLRFLGTYDLKPSQANQLHQLALARSRSQLLEASALPQDPLFPTQPQQTEEQAVPPQPQPLHALSQSMQPSLLPQQPLPSQPEPALPPLFAPVDMRDMNLQFDDVLDPMSCAACGRPISLDEELLCPCGATARHFYCIAACPHCV